MATTVHALLPAKQPIRLKQIGQQIAFSIVVVLITGITIFPLHWMLLTAIQPNDVNVAYPPRFWPEAIDLTSFVEVFGDFALAAWIMHSALIACLATAVALLLSVLGAYPLSCLRWRGRSAFGFFLFFTQMMPEAMIVIPIFIIYRHLHLTESLPGLALVDSAFVIPVGVWILKNVFDGVPSEVREAALVDGCGVFSVLWRIVLPLSGPGMVAVAVVAFFYAWNDYLFASTMITMQEIRPASSGLAGFITMGVVPIERILAGGLIFALPPAIFYLLTQRHLVTGLTAGAVKG